jgi:hypothetical protein
MFAIEEKGAMAAFMYDLRSPDTKDNTPANFNTSWTFYRFQEY